MYPEIYIVIIYCSKQLHSSAEHKMRDWIMWVTKQLLVALTSIVWKNNNMEINGTSKCLVTHVFKVSYFVLSRKK